MVSATVLTDEVEIKVEDNGAGWPKENRARLLEPYMTTRGKGTGLGLAIVSKIVEQHGGQLELHDANADENGNVGACLRFTLSLSNGQIAPIKKPNENGAEKTQTMDV